MPTLSLFRSIHNKSKLVLIIQITLDSLYFSLDVGTSFTFQENSPDRNLLYILKFFLLDINFKNIIIRLHIFYVLNMYVKFCSNWMLFIILLIDLFFIHNFKS